MPETFDLDALFADLERDISDVTHSPGAAHAVRGARRRRRTTIGAVAAGLALVLGGVVVGRGALGHGHSASPADQVVQMGQLPPPAAFHDADFDSLFVGWDPGWSYDDKLGTDKQAPLYLLSSPPCWNHLARDNGPRPIRTSKNGTVVSDSRESTAFVMWVRWPAGRPDGAAETFDTYVSEADHCAGAQRLHSRAWTEEGRAVTWRVPPPDGVQGDVYLWVAQQGAGFAAGLVGTDKGPLPDDVELRFVDAMMAGLQSPSSGGPGSSN